MCHADPPTNAVVQALGRAQEATSNVGRGWQRRVGHPLPVVMCSRCFVVNLLVGDCLRVLLDRRHIVFISWTRKIFEATGRHPQRSVVLQ
jgi:hypothetical protein